MAENKSQNVDPKRAAELRAGTSKTALAATLGVDRKTIERVEGIGRASAATVAAYVRAFGVNREWLLGTRDQKFGDAATDNLRPVSSGIEPDDRGGSPERGDELVRLLLRMTAQQPDCREVLKATLAELATTVEQLGQRMELLAARMAELLERQEATARKE